ncbi:MAG: fasciclin domain-containing protein, partial [Bacteroidales bacterium]
MIRKYLLLLASSALLFVMGCENKVWDDHYYDQPETVDQDIWEVIQADENLSLFANFIKEFKYDSLFEGTHAYTLFIPDNDAMQQMLDTGTMTRSILDYHISLHVIQSRNIKGRTKIQTLGEKFAWFTRSGDDLTLDDVPVEFESPLYRNGKYFVLQSVTLPAPNLYEFFALNNPILSDYIDSQDSIILDKELSRPIGFDSLGNTIYDTVSIIYNKFEEEFFPVSKEFRFKTATIVFPLEDDYNNALTEMAQSMGSVYVDYKDIPLDWQNDILIPHLLEHGVFENLVEESEFILPPYRDTLKMKNILGD